MEEGVHGQLLLTSLDEDLFHLLIVFQGLDHLEDRGQQQLRLVLFMAETEGQSGNRSVGPLLLPCFFIRLATHDHPVPPQGTHRQDLVLPDVHGLSEYLIGIFVIALLSVDLGLQPGHFCLEDFLLLFIFAGGLVINDLQGLHNVSFVEDAFVEPFLVPEVGFVEIELGLNSFVLDVDPKVPALLLQLQLIPLDVCVGDEQFVSLGVAAVAAHVDIGGSADHIVIEGDDLFLHVVVEHIPLPQDGVPDGHVLVLAGHPFPPVVDLSVDGLHDLGQELQVLLVLDCIVIGLIFDLLAFFQLQ